MRHADAGPVQLLVLRFAEELGGLRGNQKQNCAGSCPAGAGGAASPWGSWAPQQEAPSPPCPCAYHQARTLCMAASHAVACFLLPCASSPAVSFSRATPSAPGAEYCRDMPVARAAPPGGGRKQAQMSPPGVVARVLPALVLPGGGRDLCSAVTPAYTRAEARQAVLPT